MKKFLIVFPCDTLAYSPTILNMAEMLSERGSVDMVTLWDKRGETAAKGLPCRFLYIRIPSLIRRCLQRCFHAYCWVKAFLLYRILKKHKEEYDLIFAVDSVGYYTTRRVYGKERVIYVSLEIYDDAWLALTKKVGVDMLLIQSRERKEFLFGEAPIPYRILPNSSRSIPEHVISKKPGFRLIYMGSIYPAHGVEFCIEALTELSEQFTLTLKGIISERYRRILIKKYGRLMKTERLVLDNSYTPQTMVLDYLDKFDVGFCFYDINGLLSGNFNYISSPAGKMYAYFAAGLPVIGQDILGLHDVLEYDAGILVDRTSPQAIARAVRGVFEEYGRFSNGASRAGKALCFDSHFNAILSELLSPGCSAALENA